MNKSTQPISEKNHNVSDKAKSASVRLFVIGLMPGMAGILTLLWRDYYPQLLLMMILFVISIIMLTTAVLRLKINPNITVALIALGLTCLSFVYQPIGPEIRQSGTECVPIEDCFRPVRGGGFPIQYLIDMPGITFWGKLGTEDEFRSWAFALDIILYISLWHIAYRLIMYYRARRAKV